MDWINYGKTGTTEEQRVELERSVTSQQPLLRVGFSSIDGKSAGKMAGREIRGSYRARTPDHVLQELIFLKDKYGIDEVQFEDDNLTSNKPAAERLFNAMKEQDLGLNWCTPNGIAAWTLYNGGDDKKGYPLMRLMKDVGCYQLSFAIESGDRDVLTKIIKKPINLAQIPPLISAANGMGIWAHAFFILGFPDETLEQMNRTVDYASSLNLDSASFSIATPLPGAPLWNDCINRGILPRDFSDYRRLLLKNPVITSPYWTHEQLLEVQARGYVAINKKSAEDDRLGVYSRAADRFGKSKEDIESMVSRRNA